MADIRTRHEVTGHEADFPEDTLPAWRSLGWIPISELAEKSEPEGTTPAAAQEPTPPPAQPKAARQRADKSEE